jgi:hypothetical protein
LYICEKNSDENAEAVHQELLDDRKREVSQVAFALHYLGPVLVA